MKQILLDKSKGNIYIEEILPPALSGKGVMVRTAYSLISSGTEISMILRARENKIEQIKRMIPEDGIISYIKRKIKTGTLVKSTKSVMSTLSQDSGGGFGSLMPLGYSSAGTVIDKDSRVNKVNINEKVACGGARHAGINYVPINLCTKLHGGIDLKEAAFSTLGCIAMQGVRRANIDLGETVVIIGQGVIGQIAAQLVRVNGGYAIVTDLSQWRLDIANSLGADEVINVTEQDSVKEIMKITNGHGADKVIICAASSTSKPLRDAISMVRDKGRIVLVGAVKMEIPREPFYEKELDFVISRSYGPGRYDPLYEQKGLDYPYDAVRWTENRNMEEFVRLLAEQKINVKDLITHEYDILDASVAYDDIINNPDKTLGVILKYKQDGHKNKSGERKMFVKKDAQINKNKIKTAIIGCGNFARKYHLTNIKKIADYQLISVVNATGIKAKEIAQKNGLSYCATDYREVLEDPNVDLVVIATRHNLHAEQAIESIKAGKHVFLEKPMALSLKEMNELVDTVKNSERKFTIGFNRRFSPLIKETKKILNNISSPIIINYRVANTFSPKTSWIHDPEEGGGTIIGECCHFFDLVYYLLEKEPVRIFAEGGNLTHHGDNIYDNTIINIKMSDNSIATITFTDMGKEDFPKERIEIFAKDSIIVIDDFKKLTLYGEKNREVVLKQSDKGHFEQFVEFKKCIHGDTHLAVTYKDGVRATVCTIKTMESMKTNSSQLVDIDKYI